MKLPPQTGSIEYITAAFSAEMSCPIVCKKLHTPVVNKPKYRIGSGSDRKGDPTYCKVKKGIKEKKYENKEEIKE